MPACLTDTGALQAYGRELVSKIKVISGVRILSRAAIRMVQPAVVPGGPPLRGSSNGDSVVELVAIGASTGGPLAIEAVLKDLPDRFSAPILCVQHISDGFLPGFVSWLGTRCQRKVKIAVNGELPLSGVVYFPPDRRHLEVDGTGRLRLSDGPPVDRHRPSVTHLFASVATCYGSRAVGVLLSGMGSDGAEGLLALRRAGGRTIVQDEESCVVFGMPKVAIERGAAQWVLSLDQIASRITALCQRSETGK